MSAVVLQNGFADSLWSLEWTKGRTVSLHTFIAGCTTPRLDIALAGLGGQQVALETAVCQQCSSRSIHLLSIFFTLMSCTPSAAKANICINLSPLGVLPALCYLRLNKGQFSSTMMPPNLLTLAIYDSTSEVNPVGLSVKRLQKLTVGGSRLALVPSGIAACADLQDLGCWSGTVYSNKAEDCLYAGYECHFRMPAVNLALTCLTSWGD